MDKYQKWLIVSTIFLAAALVVPIYILSTALSATIIAANTISQNTASNERSTGSGVASFIAAQQAVQLQVTIIVVAAEVTLVAVFALTFWYGSNAAINAALTRRRKTEFTWALTFNKPHTPQASNPRRILGGSVITYFFPLALTPKISNR